jgi:hypothetical protein
MKHFGVCVCVCVVEGRNSVSFFFIFFEMATGCQIANGTPPSLLSVALPTDFSVLFFSFFLFGFLFQARVVS